MKKILLLIALATSFAVTSCNGMKNEKKVPFGGVNMFGGSNYSGVKLKPGQKRLTEEQKRQLMQARNAKKMNEAPAEQTKKKAPERPSTKNRRKVKDVQAKVKAKKNTVVKNEKSFSYVKEIGKLGVLAILFALTAYGN